MTRIEGRFRHITVQQLCLAWWLFKQGHLTYLQLRAYFAAHEMAERRRYTRTAERPLYEIDELSTLIGGSTSEATLRTVVNRLARLGLVRIEDHAIEFAGNVEQITLDDVSGFPAFFERMPHRRRTVPVPRRTVRALATGFAGSAVTGVMIALMIRSLFWHRETNQYRVDGRTKGPWIVETFDISRRAVTDARRTLIECGWLIPIETTQWQLNKWGSHDRINVHWRHVGDHAASVDDPADESVDTPEGQGCDGSESASLKRDRQIESASPDLNRSLSLTGKTNTRRPAPGRAGSAGVSMRNGAGRTKAKNGAGRTRNGAPTLRDIQAQDLRNTKRLLELYRQAVEHGMIDDSEAGRLDFVAMAERAREHADRPGAMFYWLLRERKTAFITQADEDRAAQRLREHAYGSRFDPGVNGKQVKTDSSTVSPVEFTDDERFVMACMRAAKQHRIADPFDIARKAGWNRDRWETVTLAHLTAQSARWQRASCRTLDPEQCVDGLFRSR